MYFGFTNCPDICPEELDKMGVAVDMVEKKHGPGAVLPVFISVDPARDSVPQVKQYISGQFTFAPHNESLASVLMLGTVYRLSPSYGWLDGRIRSRQTDL